MEEFLRSLAMRPEPWTAGEIILNSVIAFLLGLFIAWVYRRTNRQLTISYSFVNTLVLLSMIMCVVMMVIGNNIARAFGLAGAMSIIRFRTVVKDVRDTAFVFYALGAGMASGSGNIKIAVLGIILVGLFIGILHWTRHGSVSRNEFLLSFHMVPSDNHEEHTVYIPLFKKFFNHHRLVNVKSTRMGETLRLTFYVALKNPMDTELIVSELSALEGLQRVSLSYGDEVQN